MANRNHGLSEKEMELVQLLMADCETTGDIQAKLKRLFAGTIEQILEAELDEHLGYEKNSVLGNNSGNSRNGYGKKTITSDYGECEISVPRDRNGEFEPKVIEKRQTHTDEIEQKILAMYAKGMSQRDIEDTVLVKQNCNTFPKRSSQAFLPRSKTVINRMRSDGIVPKQNIILNVGEQFILATV